MNKLHISILLGVLSICSNFTLMSFKSHSFHVSTTEILYGEQRTLEVNSRIFTDDFELQLSKIFKVKIDLSNPKMHKSMDALVEKYIQGALQLQADKKNIKLDYLGYEINRESTQIYLESEEIVSPKNIQIMNKILFQLYNDQNNIVHTIVGGKRQSEQMPYPTFTLNFQY